MMSAAELRATGPSNARPWTFYALAACSALFLLFLYGPMLVIYILSFQGPNGGVTFPMIGVSLDWFARHRQARADGQHPGLVRAARSRSPAVVSLLTVVFSVAAGLAFRRRFPGSGVLFYLAIASLVMPSLLVGFGIGLGFRVLGWQTDLFTSALGAQLTWTLPFGLFAMFAVVDRFNRSYEEAATDLGATPWQRLRYVTLPILLPGIIGVGDGRLHAVLRRVCPHHAGDRRAQHAAARDLRADLQRHLADAVRDRHGDHGRVVPDHRHRAVVDLPHAEAPRRRGASHDADRRRRRRSDAMDPRFDVELVAVTKRYGADRRGRRDLAAHPARPAIAACWARAAAARPRPCA